MAGLRNKQNLRKHLFLKHLSIRRFILLLIGLGTMWTMFTLFQPSYLDLASEDYETREKTHYFRHNSVPKLKNDIALPVIVNRTSWIEKSLKIPWKLARQKGDPMTGIFSQLSGLEKPLVPVVIVDEHFEVLKYWYEAANVGLISPVGNTLLHIDGHSDGAIPEDMSVIPHFRLPNNATEVATMMQRNDVFIVAAAMTGFLQHYIWVWPLWDAANHEKESAHEIYDVEIGWRILFRTVDNPFYGICYCIRHRLEEKDAKIKPQWQCWDHNMSSTAYDGSALKRYMCAMEYSCVVEFVSEAMASEVLGKGGIITGKFLLDIDEDYYGCESSAMPLYKAGFNQAWIDRLSELIQNLLCASTAHQEQVADEFFHVIVESVLDFKENGCQMDSNLSVTPNVCLTDFDIDQALIQMIPSFLETAQEKLKGILCREETKLNEVLMQAILRMLEDLNNVQLQALAYVGICLRTSSSSYFFEKSLHICHGSNLPNTTEVIFHVPSPKEVLRTSVRLKKLLSSLRSHPAVITVSRSVRDGYVPWQLFKSIEKSILSVVQQSFSSVLNGSFYYDENLLGGKKGWPERYKKNLAEMQSIP